MALAARTPRPLVERKPPASGSGAFGSPGVTVGGAPIVGVGLLSKNTSIKVYKKQTHYNEWEFVFDPNQQNAMNGMASATTSHQRYGRERQHRVQASARALGLGLARVRELGLVQVQGLGSVLVPGQDLVPARGPVLVRALGPDSVRAMGPGLAARHQAQQPRPPQQPLPPRRVTRHSRNWPADQARFANSFDGPCLLYRRTADPSASLGMTKLEAASDLSICYWERENQ